MTEQSPEEKPLINKTRQELMAELTELKKTYAAELAEKDAQLVEFQGLKAAQAGWLVITPNPLYGSDPHDKPVCGVKFEKGMAFVPLTREFPRYRIEPVKETYFEKWKVSDEEKAAMRAREKTPTAKIVVDLLEKDYGYKVEFYDSARLHEIQDKVEIRTHEYALALEAMRKEQEGRKLVQPQYMGA